MPSESYTVANVTGMNQIINVHASIKIKSKVYASVWKATSIVPGLGETLWIGSGYFLSAGLALLGRTFKIYNVLWLISFGTLILLILQAKLQNFICTSYFSFNFGYNCEI